MDNSDDSQRQKSKSIQKIGVKNTPGRFLQLVNCLQLSSNIDKCIECSFYNMEGKSIDNDYDNKSCRFYEFRLLKYSKAGKLCVAGFPDPFKNVYDDDMSLWLPSQNFSVPSHLNMEASITILKNAGGQFCKLVEEESLALQLNMTDGQKKKRKILWKKFVNGVRELCDVCRTSIFNYHWTCSKCGFVVCIDCYKTKLNNLQSALKNHNKIWLLCLNQKEHTIFQLSLTQILVGDVLNYTSKLMHTLCIKHNIPINCKCIPESYICKPIDTTVSTDYVTDTFLDGMYNNTYKNESTTAYFLSTLCREDFVRRNTTEENISEKEEISTIPSKIIKDKKHKSLITKIRTQKLCTPKLSLMSNIETRVPYMWLCEGFLLRLLDPINENNYEFFQQQWKWGQPIIVSNVDKNLNPELWHPESFSRDFGDQKNDIIDFSTNNVFNDHPMCTFWNGFENVEKRLCDNQGNPLLLKLKDWPSSTDFKDMLPDRFQDLMNCLPLKEYTHRDGRYNLVSCLPQCFVRPDLGPKMYSAYGNAGTQFKKIGTTNLHLDVSDAVNVMVYVAITKSCKENDHDWYVSKALEVIEDAGCDELTMNRIKIHKEIPGALWHIYHASDAAAIRDLIIKIKVEHGKQLEYSGDPIHDQSYYLDNYLRERLYKEYGVKGYAIVQFYGDAIFIPAGAPHQVRNLHNCVKVAEDFVSPENTDHSFLLTQEFRKLTDNHTNHEDKLQIKNILYHAIKDSITVLSKYS